MKLKYSVVLGSPRSGTTFLMNALEALSNAEAVSGILFPTSIPQIVKQSLPTHIYDALALDFQASLNKYLKTGIPSSRFSKVCKFIRGCLSIQELLECLQHNWKTNLMVYKEPFLSFAPEFVYTALPESRIIHIYRDGRDCANSLIRKYNILTDEKLTQLHSPEMPLGRRYDHRYIPWWVEDGKEEYFLACTPYLRAIWMWKEMVKSCDEFFSRADVIESGRVMLLKYEDLVTNPSKYGETVVEHLGEKMNTRLSKKFNQARTRSIGLYRQRDAKEIEQASKIAKTELEIYGYI